jgi:hypothetical protein
MPRNIFISHKVKDRVAAEEIRRRAQPIWRRQSQFFRFRKDRGGSHMVPRDPRTSQKGELAHSYFIRTLRRSGIGCLFEAGFFAGCAEDEKCRLVCLHTMDVAPPSPLQRWQSVPVTDGAQLEKFLKELYVGINPELISSPEMLRTLADKIGGALSVKVRRKVKSY